MGNPSDCYSACKDSRCRGRGIVNGTAKPAPKTTCLLSPFTIQVKSSLYFGYLLGLLVCIDLFRVMTSVVFCSRYKGLLPVVPQSTFKYNSGLPKNPNVVRNLQKYYRKKI